METGTIYLRARSYDPSIGRFTTRDSYTGSASDPLSLNLYTYCANNPVLFVDPSGHSYGTLPDGTKMSINSNWDAQLFYEKYNIQNVRLNPTSTTKISNASSSDIPWWSAGQQSGITAPSEKIPGTSINRVSREQVISKNFLNYEQLDSNSMTINATYVYQTFTDNGWSKNAICAILGNMQIESGVNPGQFEGRNGQGRVMV